MTPKEIFIQGCQTIASQFPDFKATRQGRTLSRKSQNHLLEFSISFETSRRNYSGSVTIMPYIAICPTKAFKEQLSSYQLLDDDLCFYSNHLGYINPRQEYYEWNLAGASFHHSVDEISKQIKQYVLPIFELFENPQSAIEFLINHGTKFHAHIKTLDYSPVYFILGLGTKAQINEFIIHYIKSSGYKGKFIRAYQTLKALPKEHIAATSSSFVGEIILKDMIINDIDMTF
ncbi:Uncharacterised protein [Moraxella lacunata]|uniref:DUF4304 domain-containing protein n=2 Tax=Moraxella lacunata TaxID=477 RepID=A0A378TTJ3_MORLA|nr:Uncharacterised protein [Moraxella lacunata]